MTNALVLRATDDEITALQAIADQCQLATQGALGEIKAALVTARGMAQLQKSITAAMLEDFASLQGTAIGFMSDKEYPPEDLRDPIIEALFRGFRLTGNEFNVISRRFYAAKAGLERKVKTFAGLTDFEDAYDLQEVTGGTAKIMATATWKMDGVPGRLVRQKESINNQPFDNRIVVRVNNGMGHDAIIGKAKRKMFAAIYDHLTGSEHSIPEGEVGDAEIPTAEKRVQRSSLFDAAPAPAAAGNAPDPAAQQSLCSDYFQRINGLDTPAECSQCAKDIAQDKRLSSDSKRELMDLLTERRKQVSQRR